MNKYQKIKQLGKGSFGNVFLVQTTSSKSNLVLKEVGIRTLNEKERDQALMEIEILAKCKHINVIKYKEAYIAGECLCLAMEYASRGKVYVLLYSRSLFV